MTTPSPLPGSSPHPGPGGGPATGSPTTALLDVRGVSLAFDGIHALDDVSFAVRRGEVCALIGPNGAGKSSMLNVVSGLYAAQRGEVRFEGQVLSGARELSRRGIARTFQNIALFRGMTVLENVALGSDFRARSTFLEQAFRIGRAPREERRARDEAEVVLELLDIAATATTWSAGCPTACRSASSWRGPSRPGPSCSCSTSRWPG